MRYAFVPILVATFNLGNVEFLGQLTPVRFIILLGLFRGFQSGGHFLKLSNPIDRTFILFAILSIITIPFKESSINEFNFRMGLLFNVIGTYMYGRTLLYSSNTFHRLAIGSLIAIVPLSIALLIESSTGQNLYHKYLGGRSASAIFRDGWRARGPFAHPILAGTAGAVSLPYFALLWKTHRRIAFFGMIAALGVVIASHSSGPLAATALAFASLYSWRWRRHIPKLKWIIRSSILFLSMYMDRPFYYIISKIDLTGGSTGWHRSKLIDSALTHFGEWWLAGTDYTRHWMATGVSWSPNHIDITNYYIHLGVIGGFGLPLCLITILYLSFNKCIIFINSMENVDKSKAFSMWCLVASLLAHVASAVSISYFDQMFTLLYILIAAIANSEESIRDVKSKPLRDISTQQL